MSYSKQIYSLVEYFKEGEKDPSNFMVGMEFEHFILNKSTLESVSYYQDNGLEKLLHDLTALGWQPMEEESHIIGLQKEGMFITLEPGGQLELSSSPHKQLRKVAEDYFQFLGDIVPILDSRNQAIVAVGYQPHSRIADIPLLPKQRYTHLYSYYKTRGIYAHNMMLGAAATQVSIDYSSEQDYIKKCRVINFLAPMIYCTLDNTPFFEGMIHTKSSARALIWDNCDSDRCGAVDDVFSDHFGYESYAKYILRTPSILIKKDGKLIYTGNKPISEVFDPDSFSRVELEHLLSLVFTDTRTKNYIEIRMGDSIPYPFNIGYAALWKGLAYNLDNLNSLYATAMEYNECAMSNLKKDIRSNGIFAKFNGKTVINAYEDILSMAMSGLDDCEKKYLYPLVSLAEDGMTPKDITLSRLNTGKKDALKWCVLNNITKDKRCNHIAYR